LFILDTKKQIYWKKAKKYLGIALFMIFAGFVYESFSHGVYSNYILYAFVFTMAAALFYFAICAAKKKIVLQEKTMDLLAAFVTTISISFVFNGVIDIYGTTSKWSLVYWVLSAVTGIVFAVVLYKNLKGKK